MAVEGDELNMVAYGVMMLQTHFATAINALNFKPQPASTVNVLGTAKLGS